MYNNTKKTYRKIYRMSDKYSEYSEEFLLISTKVLTDKNVMSNVVFIKIAVVLIFIFAGFNYVKPENWTPFMPFGLDGVGWGGYSIFRIYRV